jgi:hypothetical protein
MFELSQASMTMARRLRIIECRNGAGRVRVTTFCGVDVESVAEKRGALVLVHSKQSKLQHSSDAKFQKY